MGITDSKNLLRGAKNHINLYPEHWARNVNFASYELQLFS
jgi:hypothetical protein